MFLSLIIFLIVENLINTSTWRKRKSLIVYKCKKLFFWKETSSYGKFKGKIFKLFEALNQHNRYDFVLWKFFPTYISLLSKWSIEKLLNKVFLARPQHSLEVYSLAWNLWFCTNVSISLLIQLYALALVTLLTYIIYIIKYITNILLIISWY